ncbi:flagellar basal-body rod protein FlgG [Candidatus Poribacteria bacterium]|nr:MAG: flagellar basal-body rod protein FlgG [Candidatus Poribacteria bacterium]
MIRALWTAASGMRAEQTAMDIIANNISNVNTIGFKRSRPDFEDLIYQVIKPAGVINIADAQIPTGIEIGHGTKLISTQRIFTVGDLQETGNKLDLAIQGDGFFKIKLGNQIVYTRNGAFKVDAQGRIVTSHGLPLEPEIIIPKEATDIFISNDGTVQVKLPDQPDGVVIGRIELVKFINPAGLHHIGRGLYEETAASGPPITGKPGENGFGYIEQGMLEMSNVKIVDEMVGLIIAQRAYEVNSKAIQAADEMLNIANNLRR